MHDTGFILIGRIVGTATSVAILGFVGGQRDKDN
jgi:hypothetical protein